MELVFFLPHANAEIHLIHTVIIALALMICTVHLVTMIIVRGLFGIALIREYAMKGAKFPIV